MTIPLFWAEIRKLSGIYDLLISLQSANSQNGSNIDSLISELCHFFCDTEHERVKSVLDKQSVGSSLIITML